MRSQFILMATALAGVLGLSSCGALLALDTSGGVAVRTTDYNPGYGYGSYRLGYDEARRQALFLSDKMAYELALNEAQFEAVYEINLDYLLNMRGERSIYGDYWVRRNSDMFYVLNPTQYNVFVNYDYFYRPVSWTNNYYSYNIYNYYDNSVYYYNQPVYYDSYRGGRNQLSNSYYAGRFGERTGSPIIIDPSDNNYQGSRGYKDYRGGAVERSGSTPSRSFGNVQNNDYRSRDTRSFSGSNNQRSFGGGQTAPSRSVTSNSFGGSRQTYDQQRSSSSSSTTTTPSRSFGNSSSTTTRSYSNSSSTTTAPTRSFGNSSSTPSRSTNTNSDSFGGSRQNYDQQRSSSSSTTTPSRSFGNSSSTTTTRSYSNSSSTTTAPTRSFESSSSTPSRSTNTNSGSFGGSRQNYDQQRSSSSSTSSSSSSAPTRSFGNSSSAPSRSTSSGSFGGSRQNINSSTQSQPSSSSGSTTAPSRSFSSTQVYN